MIQVYFTFQYLSPLPSLAIFKRRLSRHTLSSSKYSSGPSLQVISRNFFPKSILNEPFEKILHPSSVYNITKPDTEQIILKVPTFWNPLALVNIRNYLGNYGERLMTPKEASSIGSYININGQNHPTLFVSIASFRDFQCRQTIESLFMRAEFPQRIRVGVVDQYDYQEDKPCKEPLLACHNDPSQILCAHASQIDFYEMEARYAVGPVFARHLGHRMYRGEYYAMQIDAHVDFINNWDEFLIQQYVSAKNEMAVITTYLSDVTGSIDEYGNSLKKSRPIMCKSDWEGNGVNRHLRHGQQPEGETIVNGEPTLEPFWAAGFSFSRGHFVVNVPYDQHLPMVFQGEEISIGLRGFTYGYDYYTPEHSVCFHYYASGEMGQKRKRVHMFWDNALSYQGLGEKGMKRLNGIIHMNQPFITNDSWYHVDERQYGIGNVRTLDKFFETFGIDIVKQKTEDHLCMFVGRNMQKLWKPHLRNDKMGINYDEISYRFIDPIVYGRTWENYF